MDADQVGRLRDILDAARLICSSGVNLEIVWEVATIHVPELQSILEQIFAGQS